MKPRIAAITGKLEDTVISMNEGPVLIGRQTGATLKIANASVSRRHAMIEKDGDRFVIADLGSRNGTFVNDIPVRRRELQHGDRVRIGESQFFFLFEDSDEPARTSEIRFDHSEVPTETTVRMTYADVVGLMARDLNVLFKASTTINAIRDLGELQESLLHLIFEVVPAKHGVVLLKSDQATDDEFSSTFGLDRIFGPTQQITVSSTVVRRVIRDGAAMLLADTGRNEAFHSDSLIAAHSRSLLCVPLIMLGRTFGVVYLDTDVPDVHFDADHLRIVTAIAAIAAVAIQNALHLQTLETEKQLWLHDAGSRSQIIGESALTQQVREQIEEAARSELPVLILGEHGTGKELAARETHAQSRRADKPFVAVNCADPAVSLLESELFGAARGAFKGALGARKGKLELAHGGTLFLDAVGELSLELQDKLLRTLQSGELTPVGGSRSVRTDVRIISATHQDLNSSVNEGTWRQDLFSLLNGIELKMPSLRERREDIPMLANYFAARYAAQNHRQSLEISPEAHHLLCAYEWPGNIRELKNAIERAVILGVTGQILPQDLPINY